MASRFDALAAKVPNEVVTRASAHDVDTSAGTVALVTLDNGDAKGRPTTLGPSSLLELRACLESLARRARDGEIAGIAFTGTKGTFLAGADLSTVTQLETEEDGRSMAALGHEVYQIIHELPVPTFAFVNGTAMGGGLELALACDYRTVSDSAKGISLPEAFLGLIPGWSGIYLLPRLIGPEAAVEVIVKNPLNNNRSLSGHEASELGIADALVQGEDFVPRSLEWAARVVSGQEQVLRPNAVDPAEETVAQRWEKAADAAAAFIQGKTGQAAPAPLAVVDVFRRGRTLTREESREIEIETLAELMQSPQFRATVYAFLELVTKRGKRPAGAPDPSIARPVSKVGVVGAGLMAGQLALVFARRLQVPVLMTDVDEERVRKGVAAVHAEIEKLAAKGRIGEDEARRLTGLVTGTTDRSEYADADFLIEAVFEELSVKKQVFAEFEEIVREECILATNTSSLSVAAMAEGLKHPDRVIGFHFFNPVAVMPLLEIAKTDSTSEDVLSTAFVLAKGLGKTAVLVHDAAAFVVNRILLRLLGEVARAWDNGTDAETADRALDPMGLPMTPFTLLAMVGIPVAQHVSESLHAAFGDRFWVSPNQQRLIDAGVKRIWEKDENGRPHIPESTLRLLEFGDSPVSGDELLRTVQDALAEEIGLMLDEGVVASARDIDLCMILGAGWPFHLGGITPYLDRVGASERVRGREFGAIAGE